MQIALALIKRLVATGQLSANDVEAICADLPEREQNAVKAAWAEGLIPNGNKDFEPPKPVLRVVD